MKTFSELIGRTIEPQEPDRLDRCVEILAGHLPLGSKTSRFATYEVEVFNFLWDNKEKLGIKSVMKCKNLLVDGLVLLSDGRNLVVEVKRQMDWRQACQAEWQVRQFLIRHNDKEGIAPVSGAIVFSEEFSGDWKKRRRNAQNAWGWEAWYLYYQRAVDGMRMDLVMLRNGELRAYPD